MGQPYERKDVPYVQHKWQAKGLCATKTFAELWRGGKVNEIIFFADSGRTLEHKMAIMEAIDMCSRCDVRAECEAHGNAIGAVGIWGGFDAKSRLRRAKASGDIVQPPPLLWPEPPLKETGT